MRLYLVLLFLLLASASCKKTKDATVIPNASSTDSTDSISMVYNGDLVSKSYIYFTTNVRIGNNVAWDFGDGETSEVLNPRHVYDTEGVYRVRLTVNDDAGKTLTRELVIENVHTRKMLGSRDWILKMQYGYKDGVKANPLEITYHEQALVIEMTDPTTIRIGANPFFPETVLKLGISNSGYMNFTYNAYTDPNYTSLSYYITEHKLNLVIRQRKYGADGSTLIEERYITSELII